MFSSSSPLGILPAFSLGWLLVLLYSYNDDPDVPILRRPAEIKVYPSFFIQPAYPYKKPQLFLKPSKKSNNLDMATPDTEASSQAPIWISLSCKKCNCGLVF